MAFHAITPRVDRGDLLVLGLILMAPAGCGAQARTGPDRGPDHRPGAKPATAASRSGTGERLMVTASRTDPIGHAVTASQGSITAAELRLRPVYRVGQLLESVPGLVVTVHSGEGKANQFLLRGFNLDHGTDLATFIDDMPVNQPTQAHGQGYTDLHYLIPELASGIAYTKGPFYANIGDFGVVGSDHIRLTNDLPGQVSGSVGTLGDQRFFIGDTAHLAGGDTLLGAFSVEHLDGPWVHPDNYRAIKSAARWHHGRGPHAIDVTAMHYRAQWNNTTDQPLSAFTDGLIGRYGTLDPTDGGFTERYSLSAHHAYDGGADWHLTTNVFLIHSRLTLWNDFTHFLTDPVNGDQEQQDETRTTFGGGTALVLRKQIAGIAQDATFGVQGRLDDIYIDRRHTQARRVLVDCPGEPVPTGRYVCSADQVLQGNVGMYGQIVTHWTPWMRTVSALRVDYYGGRDHSLITGFRGHAGQWLPQPKGSLILGPWKKTEIYLSGGQGFHSNDIRAVLGTVPTNGIADGRIATPFMTKATSEELGLRTGIIPKLTLTAAVFRIDFASELAYDADAGVNDASAPSRREGFEVSGQYRPLRWIELNTDIASARARYFTGNPGAYDLPGTYIANAPDFIGSFGMLVDHPGGWYGGAQFRWLGGYPLIEDHSFRAPGYKELNVSAGCHFTRALQGEMAIYNVAGTHASASQYAYEYRVSPTAAPQTGPTYHPLEPRSWRFTLREAF